MVFDHQSFLMMVWKFNLGLVFGICLKISRFLVSLCAFHWCMVWNIIKINHKFHHINLISNKEFSIIFSFKTHSVHYIMFTILLKIYCISWLKSWMVTLWIMNLQMSVRYNFEDVNIYDLKPLEHSCKNMFKLWFMISNMNMVRVSVEISISKMFMHMTY